MMHVRQTASLALVVFAGWIGSAPPASAQTAAPYNQAAEALTIEPAPVVTNRIPWTRLFTDTIRDFRRMPSRDTAQWLTIGALAAVAPHPADTDVSRSLSRSRELHETVASGALIGSTPFQLGAAAATYVIGRTFNSPKITDVGADLVRAQFLAEAMTIGVKRTARRNRPEGTGFSFPSGHTTAAFASATVLERHFGWKVGVPAYAVAGYVGVSRVQMRRHYLSDVAFGAALGIVAGRTVTIGGGRRLELAPMPTDGGAGVTFKWLGKTAP